MINLNSNSRKPSVGSSQRLKLFGKRIFTLTFMLSMVFIGFINVNAQDINVNYANNISINKGVFEGFLDSTKVQDSLFYRIIEESGAPGIDFNITFSGIEGNITNLIVNERYIGGANHEVILSIYDFNSSSFLFLKEYGNVVNFESDNFDLSFLCSTCQRDGEVILNYKHDDSGIASHEFDIDYLVITSTGTSHVVDDQKGLFNVDLDDNLTMILVLLFLIAGAILVFVFDGLLGGSLIVISGLILLFSGTINILSVLIVLIGFVAFFKE